MGTQHTLFTTPLPTDIWLVSTFYNSNGCAVNSSHHFSSAKMPCHFPSACPLRVCLFDEASQSFSRQPKPLTHFFHVPLWSVSWDLLVSTRKDGRRQPPLPTQPSLFWRQSCVSEFGIPPALIRLLSSHPYSSRPAQACTSSGWLKNTS